VPRKSTGRKAANKKSSSKKTAAKKRAKKSAAPTPVLKLIKNDPYLAEFAPAIEGRHMNYLKKLSELTNSGKMSLSDFASGYLYFGLHKTDNGWVIREWAPNAKAIYLIGDFNGWKKTTKYMFKHLRGTENWELKFNHKNFTHGSHYKLIIQWD
jgi:1,4-alpha-glucan branching enzyme